MRAAWLALTAVYGACAGSYLGVVVDRLPVGRALSERSACGWCGSPVRAVDNVPVLAYLLWLGGRCRSCAGRIPARWWLLEVGMAALWAAVAAVLGPGPAVVLALVGIWSVVLGGWLLLARAAAPAGWAGWAAAALPVLAVAVLSLGFKAALAGRWGSCAALGAAGAAVLVAAALVAPGGSSTTAHPGRR